MKDSENLLFYYDNQKNLLLASCFFGENVNIYFAKEKCTTKTQIDICGNLTTLQRVSIKNSKNKYDFIFILGDEILLESDFEILTLLCENLPTIIVASNIENYVNLKTKHFSTSFASVNSQKEKKEKLEIDATIEDSILETQQQVLEEKLSTEKNTEQVENDKDIIQNTEEVNELTDFNNNDVINLKKSKEFKQIETKEENIPCNSMEFIYSYSENDFYELSKAKKVNFVNDNDLIGKKLSKFIIETSIINSYKILNQDKNKNILFDRVNKDEIFNLIKEDINITNHLLLTVSDYNNFNYYKFLSGKGFISNIKRNFALHQFLIKLLKEQTYPNVKTSLSTLEMFIRLSSIAGVENKNNKKLQNKLSKFLIINS